MSITKKFIATTLVLSAESLPLWAQTTSSAPVATPPAQTATTDKEAPRVPVAVQGDPRQQVVNGTVAAPTPIQRKPAKQLDQNKALWGGWLPLPELKFVGF